MARECGTCTKCCEGWLPTNIKGHEVSHGKPCFFVEINKGCSIYKDRPQDPCKRYSCTWLVNENMPEEFKPEKSGVIMHWVIKEKFWVLVQAPNNPTSHFLSWAINFAMSKKENILWFVDDKSWWIGDMNFCKEMELRHG